MLHCAQGTVGCPKLKEYQTLWDSKIDLGKFYFKTFNKYREKVVNIRTNS